MSAKQNPFHPHVLMKKWMDEKTEVLVHCSNDKCYSGHIKCISTYEIVLAEEDRLVVIFKGSLSFIMPRAPKE